MLVEPASKIEHEDDQDDPQRKKKYDTKADFHLIKIFQGRKICFATPAQ